VESSDYIRFRNGFIGIIREVSFAAPLNKYYEKGVLREQKTYLKELPSS